MRELVEVVGEKSKELGLKPSSQDQSGFDALHTLQTLLSTAHLDKAIHEPKEELSLWHLAGDRWAIAQANSSAVIGGSVFMKVILGVVDSGSKDTSRRNTLLSIFYAALLNVISSCGIKYIIANGDDSIFWVDNIERYTSVAERYGFKIRDLNTSSDSFQFCSHKYDMKTGLAELTSWPKSVYRILTHKEMEYDDAMQSLEEMRHGDIHPKVKKYIVHKFALPVYPPV
jgi:hypothetical protein